ncbi:major facilitator superfamily transporter protein [Rutstroemia sp. NJR-2017a WRK4]|nr:major facilitator superfamily transporter protein [Rutstroemia sp. NJR-2017a WRK4]
MLLFFQSLGGTLIVSAAQSMFQNELLSTLARKLPAISPSTIFSVGASDLQRTFSKEQLPGIDTSYIRGLHMAFALAIPMAGVATLVGCAQKGFRLTVPGQERDKNEIVDGEEK